MIHSYIQDNEVCERYVTGRLSAEDRSRFEEHLSDCSECLNEVETLESFRRGLRTTVAEDAVGRIVVPTGVLAWLTRSRRTRLVLLAGFILLISVPAIAGYFFARWRAHERLNDMEKVYADLQREYAQQQQSEERLKAELKLSESKHPNDLQPPAAANRLPELADSLPVFTLNGVRDPDQDAPANQLTIPTSTPVIVLLLDAERDPDAHSYDASIFDQQGHLIWSTKGLRLNRPDGIAIAVRSNLFASANYLLKLEGCDRQKDCHLESTFSFRTTLRQ